MGILSKILGGTDVIKAGFDLIDAMHTSDVEMIEAKTKAKTALITAYAPFKVAQRYIALLFGFTYIGSFVLILIMTVAGEGNIVGVKELLGDFYIGEIMFTIVAFYFGGGAFEGAMKSKGKP
jgi:hypothetical protein